jgi:DNA-directed RNA polymerase subunit M/transcription elongation factor TFIIS
MHKPSPFSRDTADDATRRMSVAVANWLCGTLEGISRDDADLSLADALDSWLRTQKRDGETLYTGSIACVSCGHRWEYLILSTETGTIRCPNCGTVQSVSPPKIDTIRTSPLNKQALEKIREDIGAVVSKIERFNRTMKNNNGKRGS